MIEFNNLLKVNGQLELPGDKSISHRAVMFASIAKGQSVIQNCADSDDVNSTLSCFSQLGVKVKKEQEKIFIDGNGLYGLKSPKEKLDTGNSGTLARLIMGILCGQKFSSQLIGDESLSIRPMKRIIDPLSLMGARINSTSGTLPILIEPINQIKNITYTLPVASAQIKSAILLAGLHSKDKSVVIEFSPSRNHTEIMLDLPCQQIDNKKHISVSSENIPSNNNYFVPSDISTASFFIVLASVLQNSEILIKNISLNPTRDGIIKVLKLMGALITIVDKKRSNNEVYGDILVKSSQLTNIKIDESIIPNIIDEIPILAIAGIHAEGDFEVRGAKELRVKETDRITAMCKNLKKTGLDIIEYEDGFKISGNSKNEQVVFESYGDHRIAMAFGIYSLISKSGGKINNFECASVSNPMFIEQLSNIC